MQAWSKNKTIKFLLIALLPLVVELSFAQVLPNTPRQVICSGDSIIFHYPLKHDTVIWQYNSGTQWLDIADTNSNFKIYDDTLVSINIHGVGDVLIRSKVDTGGLAVFNVFSSSITVNFVKSFNKLEITPLSQQKCYNSSSDAIIVANSRISNKDSLYFLWYSAIKNQNYIKLDSGIVKQRVINPLLDSLQVFVQLRDIYGCNVINSDTVEVYVYNEFNGPEIKASGDTFCFANNTLSLTTDKKSRGGSGNLKYSWLTSNDGTKFTQIQGANADSLIQNNLKGTRYFKLITTDQFGCGEDTTSTLKAYVFGEYSEHQIFGSDTVCFNENSDTIGISKFANGAGRLTYTWQTQNGNTWKDTLNGQSKFLLKNIRSNKVFRLKTISLNGCGTFLSDTVEIIALKPFSNGILGSDQSICNNTDPKPIKLLLAPDGAGDIFESKWQISRDSILFKDTLNSGLIDSIALEKLKGNVYLRAIFTAKSGCAQDTSNTVRINVYKPLSPMIIKAKDTVCFNSAKDTISPVIRAFGGGGKLSHSWYFDNGSGFKKVLGSNSSGEELVFSGLKSTTTFYATTSSVFGCGTVKSNEFRITVLDSIVSPLIGIDHSICYNTRTDSVRLLADAQGGGDKFDYQWQQSIVDWQDVTFNQKEYLLLEGQKESSKIRVTATNAYSCGTVYSNEITVTVFDTIQVGILGDVSPICFNSKTDTITFEKSFVGGGDDFDYEWYISNNGVDYGRSVKTGLHITLDELKETKYIKVLGKSNFGCGEYFSNVIIQEVYDSLIPGNIVHNMKDTLCFGNKAHTIYQNNKAAGGGDSLLYEWYRSLNGNNWGLLKSGNSGVLEKRRLYKTQLIKLEVTSLKGCGTVETNTIEFTVLENPDSSSITGDDQVCANSIGNKYELDNYKSSYDYAWKFSDGFIQKAENNFEVVYVKWGNYDFIDTIKIGVTDPSTSCQITIPFAVFSNGQYAPSIGEIKQKENSTILVYNDSNRILNYRWGYTIKENGQETIYNDWNYRYYQYNEAIDTNLREYWVDVWKGDQGCTTRTYFHGVHWSGSNFMPVNNSVKLVQNPVSELIILENTNLKSLEIDVYGVEGRLEKSFANLSESSIVLNVSDLVAGIYFVHVRAEENIVSTFKVIKQ